MSLAKSAVLTAVRGRALLAAVALVLAAGCGREPAPADGAPRTIVIGLVAKSQGNAVFQAARRGAEAAARELGAARGVTVRIDWQTPPSEDAQRQAAAVEQLARAGVPGIAVSCSDANTLAPAIDKAVELGSHVVCFDSDAPTSRRFVFFGTDDVACGRAVMAELAAALDGRGTIAILAGNAAAPNLRRRVEGVLDELARHPGLSLAADGIYYHAETPEQAAETINRAQTSRPEIDGWALVGGWPLYTRSTLAWSPGRPRLVSVDALPAQLPYLEQGYVDVLLAQDCFGWGWRSVELLLDRILDGKEPQGGPVLFDPLVAVRQPDAAEYARKWESWLGR